jgi:hypothetical protein
MTILLIISLACTFLTGCIFASVMGSIRRQLARVTFPLSNKQLAYIAHEATRAYRQSKGDMRMKSWNNVTEPVRKAMAARIAAYRRSPIRPDASDPVELHLQAVIVGLAG